MIVFKTLGAAQRRMLGRRRARPAAGGPDPDPAPVPVPVTRVTVIRADAFEGEQAATTWLRGLRAARDGADGEAEQALAVVNRSVYAHRVAAADPYLQEPERDQALATRVGFGSGEELAEGRFQEALELPAAHPRRRRRAEVLNPQERLAAILGGRETVLACEDLVMRARLDLDQDRPRAAALQARAALESLLAELTEEKGTGETQTTDLAGLRECRTAVEEAAAGALAGAPDEAAVEAVRGAVETMERVLRRRRYGGEI